MSLRFERWIYPGFDWLGDRNERGSAQRLESVLGNGRMSGVEHATLARALALRAFGGGRRALSPVIVARIRGHLEAARRSPDRAAPHLVVEAARLSWSLHLFEKQVSDGLRELDGGKERWPRLAQEFEGHAVRILLEVGLPDEAVRFLDRSPDDVRGSPDYDVAAAVFDREAGYPALALSRLERVLSVTPDSADALFERASTLWVLEAHSEALADLYRLEKVRVGCPACTRNLIRGALACGRVDEARNVFARARAFVRSDPALRLEIRQSSDASPSQGPSSDKRLQGDLSFMSLTDILGLLGYRKSSGRLYIEAPGARRAEIRLIKGQLVDARLPGLSSTGTFTSAEEQLLRVLEELLEWEEGRFILEPSLPADQAVETAIDTPVALLQACANLDARRRAESL